MTKIDRMYLYPKLLLIGLVLSMSLVACGGNTPQPIDWTESGDSSSFGEIDEPSAEVSSPEINKPVNEMTHQEFIDFVGEKACASMQETGVPVSVTLAQAILETGWGKHTIQDANNLFGVKGEGPAGSIEVPTEECNADGCYTTTAKFRKYNSFDESISDHASIFSLSYYTGAMKHTDDPDEFARQLTGVYATDPEYGNKLISIMQQNNLYTYDEKCGG